MLKPKFAYYWVWDKEIIPFYKMPLGNAYSDVTQETLLKYGFEVPETPTYEEWKKRLNSGVL